MSPHGAADGPTDGRDDGLGDEVPGLDLAALRAFVDRAAPGLLSGPLRARVIAGGRSNLTYVVGDGDRTVVVRRPPLGHVLATAHDMEREHRVISALRDTAVPVPETYALCTDDAVVGAPFYVMEHVPGTPYRRRGELEPLGEARTRTISTRLVETLADLHAVDPAEVGLADFGRPDGFLERQVRRWHRQLEQSRTREVPGLDELHARLARSVPPETPPAVVHGDYRLDNLLVDDHDRVRAVLDWEMATLGDPLTDVALMVVYGRLARIVGGAGVTDANLAPGFVSGADGVDLWAARTGRDVSSLDFYLGLAYFKLAVILEGIHYRHVHGQTVGDGFDTIGEAVGPLVDGGLAATADL